VNFPPDGTLAGYARAAVDLRVQMVDYHRTQLAPAYVKAFLDSRGGHADPHAEADPAAVEAMSRITGTPWRVGEVYVVAPAMTAIVAAAAQALDLTGEILTPEAAPDEHGVLFLPEPIYQRGLGGRVVSIGAITWTHTTALGSARSCWMVCGWADAHDPADPSAVTRRDLINTRPDLTIRFGPYILADFAEIPIGTPVAARPDLPDPDERDRDWQPAPDGRFCLEDATNATPVCAAIAYAFWCIQAQPLATVAPAPVDRAARRRAVRARIRHEARVVMLRRATNMAERPEGEAKWHYRVRFVVRGHWRHLTNRDGTRYRIWIHQHIKGPDGAPLLHGEKVAILAR
jgi:hypothetical protein